MKILFISTILLLGINLSGISQNENNISIDSTLAKRFTISGFCLCKTTFTDLQKLTNDFKEITVEEMDTPPNCFSHDGRYENGKGLYSEKYTGMVFQKEKESNLLSKIRLTKAFKGYLPDGSFIDMENLTLEKVFQLYPSLKNKWGSRGCSEYWNFSNDTICFYVKIDKNIQPQFPVNETYYLDKPIDAIDFVASCYGIFHKPIDISKKPTNEPLFFLDNIKVNRGVLSLYDPKEIAAVAVYKDSTAIKMAGNEAKNGVIYITTKVTAREKYWNYFKSKSPDYTKVVPSINKEVNVIYILNDKVLEKEFEGDLFFIDDDSFIDMKVIDKKQLKKDYKVRNKKWGIIIRTHSKKKE